MYNYNYLIPEERPTWRSAQEIEIAALRHENRRIQNLHEEAGWHLPQAQGEGDQKAGFLSFITRPLQLLAALIG
jgi:hypothetical protein